MSITIMLLSEPLVRKGVYEMRKKNVKATEGDFREFVALRHNGVELNHLVQDYGRKVAMGFESLYQKFYNGGVSC